jgi:hypothetical protein
MNTPLYWTVFISPDGVHIRGFTVYTNAKTYQLDFFLIWINIEKVHINIPIRIDNDRASHEELNKNSITILCKTVI